jgi:hypothetical protein
MMGMMGPKASHLSSSLWPVSTCPKQISLANVITANLSVNKMASQLKGICIRNLEEEV